ncbi:Fe(3+)-siderophore ABC transporter permease [Pantoea sp. Eser]|nr:Fe(3+)-siderophore ABC transporter permease [Pantoea sp. Eser]
MLLLLLLALSLMLGAKSISFHDVTQALLTRCSSADCIIVRDARLSRTLAGLLACVGLGAAGALMQSLTRNPLADPGILGINARASFAVVLGIALFGADSPADWLGFAFSGALLLARSLNGLSMGGEMATALGTRVARTQLIGLLAIALLSGAATAAVGPIAFVGLMTPHLARWLFGNDHRWILLGTILIKPCLLLAADILGRALVPGELRVSIVTAILGAPMLIVLVRRKIGRGAV